MKRITAFVLCLAMVIASIALLSSCTESKTSVTTQAPTTQGTQPTQGTQSQNTQPAGAPVTMAPTTTVAKRWLDDLPEDLRFENQPEIKFITAGNEKFSARSIYVETPTDAVESSIVNRNRAIEERLGVKIVLVQNTGYKELQSVVSPVLTSQGSDYDVIGGYQYFDITMANKGWLVNLTKLADYNADYINIEKPYWATDYIKNISYKDNIFWLTGDLSMFYIGGMYCIFVNKTIYEKSLAATYGDIYQFVKDGKWTFDTMAEMASIAYVQGDEAVYDDDVYGFGYQNDATSDGLAIGAGVNWTTVEADGSIALSFTNTNEKLIDYMAKLYNLTNAPYARTQKSPVNPYPSGDDGVLFEDFAQDKLLFAASRVQLAELYLREMESDYYVIPFPKLNESQTEYRTSVMDACSLYGIALGSENVPATAATLEALAAETYKNVTPEYYELALKYKYTRDDDGKSAEMIQFIHDTVYTDFGYAWMAIVTDGTFIRVNISANPTNALKKAQSGWAKKLSDLLLTFEKNGKE